AWRLGFPVTFQPAFARRRAGVPSKDKCKCSLLPSGDAHKNRFVVPIPGPRWVRQVVNGCECNLRWPRILETAGMRTATDRPPLERARKTIGVRAPHPWRTRKRTSKRARPLKI